MHAVKHTPVRPQHRHSCMAPCGVDTAGSGAGKLTSMLVSDARADACFLRGSSQGGKYVVCGKCQVDVVGMYYTSTCVADHNLCTRCFGAELAR